MNRYRTKKVFCKFHPHKRCEHFCRDHKALLCSVCLRDKHRDCQVADDHEFKNYYGKKIHEARLAIETEKNEIIAKTHTVVAALDAGVARLEKYRKDLDSVIGRISDMKAEVEMQRNDIRKTSQSLQEIERSLATAYDLRTCQQCYGDIDIERIKFERKQRKMLQIPNRLNEDVTATISVLQKKLKSIRNGINSQLSSSKLTQQFGNTRSYKEMTSSYLPYFDLQEKVLSRRSRSFRKDPNFARWPVQDDGRIDHRYKNKTVRLPPMN